MGERYVELEQLRRLPSVFVGPDGRVVDPGAPPAHLSSLKERGVGGGGRAGASSSGSSNELPFGCPRSTCFKAFRTWLGVKRHLMRCTLKLIVPCSTYVD